MSRPPPPVSTSLPAPPVRELLKESPASESPAEPPVMFSNPVIESVPVLPAAFVRFTLTLVVYEA